MIWSFPVNSFVPPSSRVLEQRSREETGKVKRSGNKVGQRKTFDHTTCHVVTYSIPCWIWLVSGIGMSKYHPESARPRTSTLRPAILILRANLSKLRITPIPPALSNKYYMSFLISRQWRWSLPLSSFMFVSWFVRLGTLRFTYSLARLFLYLFF